MFDESGDPMNSLAAELALAGYDVYGYSVRNTFVPPRGCSTGAFDCSVMAHWGWAESWLPDIEYIRQNVKGNVKPAIGGISRGAALAIAAINQNPNAYSGLLAWDVMLYSENPRIIGINTFACNSLTAAVNNGVYANEAIGNLKIIVPLNIFAAMNVFSTPGPQFTGNFIQLVANATRTGFQFADYERVKAIIATTTDVEPIAGTRDGVCSMKGDRTFTGNLASFSGPILAFEEEFGFGPYMQDTINLTSSTNVRLVFNPGEGHLDSWMSPDHVAKIDSVIIDWLDNDVFPEQRLRR
jgi:hypothetical protein